MKFSEAMVLGLPEIQFTNSTWLGLCSSREYRCSGCLIGAALYSMGKRGRLMGDFDLISKEVEAIWPWTKIFREIKLGCPICGSFSSLGPSSVAGIMTHLANHYGLYLKYPDNSWSLSAKQIADYIHSFEPKETERQATEETECVLQT
jgi:hypothetical protein